MKLWQILNKSILVLEIIGIHIPISIFLFVIGLPGSFIRLVDIGDTDAFIIFALALLSSAATIAVWYLTIASLLNKPVLEHKYRKYWYLVVLGIVITIISYFGSYLPTPELYSGGWWFYDQLTSFVMGAPLAIPAVHVFLSAHLGLNGTYCTDR